MSYTRDLLGRAEFTTYNSGMAAKSCADSAGRTANVTDTTPGAPSVTATYTPHGALSTVQYGSAFTQTWEYSADRLQPTSATVPNLLTLSYYYCPSHAASCTTNNGNVLTQMISTPTLSFDQEYGYDALNRLTTVTESSGATVNWNQQFGYDRYGNRGQISVTKQLSTSSAIPPVTAAVLNGTSTVPFGVTNNQWTGAGYANGNLQTVTAQPGLLYQYDTENRLVSAQSATTVATTYTYDGDGRRVIKVAPPTTSGGTGVTTVYVYDADGNVASEYGGPAVSAPEYVVADSLGSTRLVTNASGAVVERRDYAPFGEELNQGVGSRDATYGTGTYPVVPGNPIETEFTGKIRDSESGLDYFGARYYASNMGRFMSPDPISFQARMLYDPQSFNLYSYVRNNPLTLTDPTGEAIELTGDDAERKKELDALKNGVGAQAGAYLYDNAQTDKNGVTTHYVGILSGGPDGKGPSFDSINSASNALSGIVTDSHVAALGVVNPGTEKEGVVIGPIPNTPGLTGDFGGKIMSYIMDTTQKSAGRLPGDMMSNGRPGEINSGILAFHELGHQMYQLQHPIASWFDNLTGRSRSNQQAVDLENKVRQTQHPNGPTRTEHDRQ
jgi:RHS repeat-associated protein